MNSRRALTTLAVAVAVAAAGCGYALAGRGNTLPTSIRSIGVPPIVNQSGLPEIDRYLVEAVRAELQSRGRYVIQPEATGVDAVFNATIASVTSQPSGFNESRQATRLQIVLTASVEFRDLQQDKVLWSNPSVRVIDEYPIASTDNPNDASALFRQYTSAYERMAAKFAREVVTSVFDAF
jgi:outer membrane lipopolysaccharide assembly protein LptE/RlpB